MSPWPEWNSVFVLDPVQTAVSESLFILLGVHLELDKSLWRLSQELLHNIIICNQHDPKNTIFTCQGFNGFIDSHEPVVSFHAHLSYLLLRWSSTLVAQRRLY